MKYLTIIAILLACAFTAQAQSDLSFDKVVFMELRPLQDTSFTVPAGKVWKVDQANNGNTSGAHTIYMKNASGVQIALLHYNNDSATDLLPFFLPEGYTGSFYNNTSSVYGFVSILQFNKGQ